LSTAFGFSLSSSLRFFMKNRKELERLNPNAVLKHRYHVRQQRS